MSDKFNEQFPSFSGHHGYAVKNVSENNPTFLFLKTYSQRSIIKTCIDKQKVKKAINKVRDWGFEQDENAIWLAFANKLKEELNLI